MMQTVTFYTTQNLHIYNEHWAEKNARSSKCRRFSLLSDLNGPGFQSCVGG